MENNTLSNDATEFGVPKKKSVILLFFISIITLGIYLPIWYIKRSPELNNLRTKTRANKNIAIIFLIVLIFANISGLASKIIASTEKITLENISFSDVPIYFTITFITSLTLYLISFLIFLTLAFQARKILNETLINKGVTRKVSGLFTFFFNFFYLQYEINRIIEDKEMEERSGPWIAFILLVLIPLLSILTIIILTAAGIKVFAS